MNAPAAFFLPGVPVQGGWGRLRDDELHISYRKYNIITKGVGGWGRVGGSGGGGFVHDFIQLLFRPDAAFLLQFGFVAH